MSPRVLLLAPIVRDLQPDTDLGATVDELAGALATRSTVEVARVETLAEIEQALRRYRPDVVFNACETVEGRSDGEALVPALLDRLGAPYTGNPARCLRLCLHKARTSIVLRAAGVPVPATFDPRASVRFPVIVKPAREDGSVGIHAGSVVHDEEGLARALGELGRPAIVQEYVEGREIAVAFLGWPLPRVLSPGEIVYDERAFAGRAQILTYASKWDPTSIDYGATRSVGAALDPALLARLSELTRHAASALGMRDYGRIDFRVDRAGRALVIDANPNCDLARDAGFMRAAHRSGLDHATTASAILDCALARRSAAPSEGAAK